MEFELTHNTVKELQKLYPDCPHFFD